MEEFKTINEKGIATIIEKKSKFIGIIIPVEGEKEAEDVLQKAKREYVNARHCCYAYRVIKGKQVIEKCSDDGEPSGTAGTPILTILTKNDLKNVIIIVIRYFGGILLGTGGLVRAYSEATKQSLNKTQIIKKELGYEVELQVKYENLKYLKYYLNLNRIKITKEEYSDFVKIIVEINQKEYKKINDEKNDKMLKILQKDIIKTKYIEK